MRLVFMGTPAFAVPALEAVAAAGHTVLAVVTRPDRPRRHGGAVPEPSPVGALAAARGWPLLRPATLKDPDIVTALAALAPDLVVVVAYGQILPPAVLDLPRFGCVNLHASLLPRYRGAAPIARAVMAGETATGLSTMQMDRGLDTGDVLGTVACAIGSEETAGELTDRMAGIGAGLLTGTLEAIAAGTVARTPQDDTRATWAPPLRRSEAPIDWNRDADAVAAHIRGCNPWPVAETGRRGERLQLLRAVPDPGPPRLPGAAHPGPQTAVPGSVIEASGDRLIAACGGGTRLRILTLRRPGRGALAAREAINGRLVGDGDRFTPIGD